jgi:hypothetical protein
MWLRRKIAGFLTWLGKVTLLFTLSFAGITLAAHALVWIKSGQWPATFVLGEPFGDTLRDIGVAAPSSSWVMVQALLNWIMAKPTWMIAFVSGVSLGLVLLTWGDMMERSIRFELRHRALSRDRKLDEE